MVDIIHRLVHFLTPPYNMALTEQQRQQLLQAKAQGLTKEQAIASVFSTSLPKSTFPETRFGDFGQDFVSSFQGVGTDLFQRGQNIRQGFQAGARGEQTPFETGAQMAGNVLGGAGDIAFRGVQAVTTPFLRESEERAIEGGFNKALEATGLPQAIAETSPRTQRNIVGGLGLFEGATAGLGTTAIKPVTSRVSNFFNRVTGRVPEGGATPPTPQITPERIGTNLEKRYRTAANDPNLTPAEKQAAAEAALTVREKWIGLRPDEKKRLQEMGEGKISEYIDAVHLRNVSDTPVPNQTMPEGVWGAQELGNYYVEQAFDGLKKQLDDTGSEIGLTRRKLGTVKLQQPQVQAIDNAFSSQLDNLGLTVRNGQVVELPNRISPAVSGDISVMQSLYEDLLKFKQSPTVTNAYDLRANFDSRIKFNKSAREASNAVDPVSRQVRKVIADETARVIGKQNAAELQRYSQFMDAYSDVRSYVDRSAGSEFLLRRALSGLGREQRDVLDAIKTHTGIDLMNDATAMKIALERFGNEAQQNLFKQEVSRAGMDIASVMSGSPVGIGAVALQRLAQFGIKEEDIIKAAAAGTGGYLLMAYYEDAGITPAGLAVLAAMPDGARKQAIKQAQDVAKVTGRNVDELTKYENGVPESELDRMFRRQDEETWKDRGMETVGDGTIKPTSVTD
jgi:hypothetical protein